MKNPNVRKRILYFQPYKFDKVGAYLEKMALQSWKFASIERGETARRGRCFRFEKAEPQKLHYAVKPTMSTCVGWELVCATEAFGVFVSAQETRPPFVMDEKDEQKAVVKETLRQNIVAWVLSLLYFILFYTFFWLFKHGYFSIFTSYFALALFLLHLLLYAFLLKPVIGLIAWVIRYKRGASPKNGCRIWTRKKRIVLVAVVMLVVFGSIGLDKLTSSAAESHIDSLRWYNATFLASETSHSYTFANGETKWFSVFKSPFNFFVDWELKTGMRGGPFSDRMPAKELDPAPFGAKRAVEVYYSSRGSNYSSIFIVFDRFMIVSSTYNEEPLTPAQVVGILTVFN